MMIKEYQLTVQRSKTTASSQRQLSRTFSIPRILPVVYHQKIRKHYSLFGRSQSPSGSCFQGRVQFCSSKAKKGQGRAPQPNEFRCSPSGARKCKLSEKVTEMTLEQHS